MSQFAKSGIAPSGKIGPTLTIRVPNRYAVSTGTVLDVQDVTEPSISFTVSTRKHVDFNFTSNDLTLTIDDFDERYITPAVEALASTVDADGLALYDEIPNLVGTAGTTPASALVWLNANQKLNEFAAPTSGPRYAVINPAAEAATVNGLSSLFHAGGAISQQYTKGMMGEALGLNFKMDQNVKGHTTGTRAASGGTTITSTSTSGDTTLALTTGSGHTITEGDVFTIANVYAVNPISKQSTGNLQQFVCRETATASGTSIAALSIYPAVTSSGYAQTVNALPQAGAAVTFVGTASTAYPQNIVCHKDAITLVTADLEVPRGDVDFAAREQYQGISLRVVRQYDINNDSFPCRIDVLYGWKVLRPEWACRVIG